MGTSRKLEMEVSIFLDPETGIEVMLRIKTNKYES
jgi:hypothetical protein